MSSILYYSNYCEHSKKLLQSLSKTQVSKEIHFICIDKRERDPNSGKVNIILESGQKIVMPENVSKVPALLLLTKNFQVLYGDTSNEYLKPQQEVVTRQATSNNMEPMAFSLGANAGLFGSGVASDQYSFLDMDADSLKATGDGGMRQMHSYVTLNHADAISTPQDSENYKQNKLPENMTIEKLQQQRDQELSVLSQQQKRV
jgi:hypothetical protein